MKDVAMEEPTAMKDDALTRIQREIIEVTQRENEHKKIHPTFARKMSENDIIINNNNDEDMNGSNEKVNGHHDNGTDHRQLQRAVSTSYLTNGSTPTKTNGHNGTNGFNRRFTPNTAQKGIMQRFIASKGKLNVTSLNSTSPTTQKQYDIITSPPVVVSPPVIAKTPDGKPIRKGFVPVQEKIQKELQDLKDREIELKLLRKKNSTYQLDFSSMDLSDKESDVESDDDVPLPGKLKITKSIGELYEAMGDVRTPSPYQGSGPDSYGSLKPAKSLAELCDLAPGEEPLAPSSTKLIAKWESLIQQKQESGAA